MTKTFKELEKSPFKGIELNYITESGFLSAIERNSSLIYYTHPKEDMVTPISKLKEFHKWLGEVIEYVEENTPEYSFEEAKEHMKKGKVAQFGDSLFEINGTLLIEKPYGEENFDVATVTLPMLEEKNWRLL